MEEKTISINRLSTRPEANRNAWQQIRDICCRTGNGGAPIPFERWRLFARIWIDPYERIIPHWTYVAAYGENVIGYVTGCPDTRRFTCARFWRFYLPLATQLILGGYGECPDRKRFLRRILRMEKTPERFFPRQLRSELRQHYPAHLHINLEAPFRHRGIGVRLIDALLRDLRSADVEGIHVYCGAGPLEFYRSYGFKELMQVDCRGNPVYALGFSLARASRHLRS